MTKRLDFIDLKTQYAQLKTSIDARIQRVLDHGQFIMGPEVRELEEKLEAYSGARHCITCASGTEALLMSLMALGIGRGDEVITTPFTFVATAEVIVLLGARPVFVDIEPDTCLMDAHQVEARISPRTKAIMPVSLYGQVCDMDAINAIAARHGNIPVIEDAAQSFGASYAEMGGKWKKSGNLSTIGCTSFFPSKPLGCYGDGGAMFTNDAALAQALREIRVHGQERRYHHTRIGLGGRMDTLQCAVLLGKLERFEWEVDRRITLGAQYAQLLTQQAPAASLTTVRSGRNSVWAQYTIQVPRRSQVQAYLQERGIPTAVHYPVPINRQPAYAHLFSGENFPHSDSASARVMSLPMSADLQPSDMQNVVATLAEALRAE